MKHATFSTIASFIHPWDAYIAKGRLETEGIPVVVVDEYYIWMKWMHSQAWGGIKLQVLSKYTHKANKIISNHLNGEYEEALSVVYPEYKRVSCVRCGASNYRLSSSRMFSIMSVILLVTGYIFPPVKSMYKCKECNHTWE